MQDGTYQVLRSGDWLTIEPNTGYFVGLQADSRAARKAPYIGVWTAPNGTKYFDPSRYEVFREDAVKLGQVHDQIAIWDCKRKEEIYL